eukprot:14712599-Ditylum_brightwellii.AAC.1
MGGNSSGCGGKWQYGGRLALVYFLLVASLVVAVTMRKWLPSEGGFPLPRVNVVGLERTLGEEGNLT